MTRICPRCGKVEVVQLIAGKPICPNCGNETESLRGSHRAKDNPLCQTAQALGETH